MLSYELFLKSHAKEIAEIFNADSLLREKMGWTYAEKVAVEDVVQKQKEWEQKKHGICYCILLCGDLLGSISYYRTCGNEVACGYWLKSSCWGRGYMTQAFAWGIEQFIKQGFQKATANIAVNNIASLKIWRRYHAEEILDGNRYKVMLHLKRLKIDFD